MTDATVAIAETPRKPWFSKIDDKMWELFGADLKERVAWDVGDRVEGRWRLEVELGAFCWYNGRITQVNSDGTYAVQFNDGDFEDSEPLEWLRQPDRGPLKPVIPYVRAAFFPVPSFWRWIVSTKNRNAVEYFVKILLNIIFGIYRVALGLPLLLLFMIPAIMINAVLVWVLGILQMLACGMCGKYWAAELWDLLHIPSGGPGNPPTRANVDYIRSLNPWRENNYINISG